MTVLAEEAAAPEAAPAAARASNGHRINYSKPRRSKAYGTVAGPGGYGRSPYRVDYGEPKIRPLPSPGRSSPSRRPARLPNIPGGRAGPHRNYQGVILAEFVAAIILTAATPISTGKNKAGLSPYAAGDVAQLAALTLVYLILALLSMGGHGAGKFAAWFGGLILLGVGLGEASTIARTLNLFGGGSGPGLAQSGLAEGSAGQINPNAPSTSPAQPTSGPGLAEGSAGPLLGG